MPLSKSFSFNFRKLRNEGGETRNEEGKLFKNRDKFQNKRVLSETVGVKQENSVLTGTKNVGKGPQSAPAPIIKVFSFSVEVIHELQNNPRFKERQTYQENRLSRSYTNIKEGESKEAFLSSKGSRSVSELVSSFDRRLNTVEERPNQLLLSPSAALEERKSFSLSALTPRSSQAVEVSLHAYYFI